MSTTVTTVHELDGFPGDFVMGADEHIERIPEAEDWCCEQCEDSRYETWSRRIKFPATIISTPKEAQS